MRSNATGRRALGEHGLSRTYASPRETNRYGVLCTAFAAIAAAALVWLWSLTLPGFNPPNWIRILGVVWLPIGSAGSVMTGILGRRGPGRIWVVVGLTLVVLTLAGFIILISTAD